MPGITEQPVVWFSIPAADIQRAVKFYNQALGLAMEVVDFDGTPSAFFPMVEGQAGGHLTLDPGRAGLPGSVMVYLNGGEALDPTLEKIRHAGGVLTLPRTVIGGGNGVFAHFQDSEGNEVGVWAPQ